MFLVAVDWYGFFPCSQCESLEIRGVDGPADFYDAQILHVFWSK